MPGGTQHLLNIQELLWPLILTLGILAAYCFKWINRVRIGRLQWAKFSPLKGERQGTPNSPTKSTLDPSQSTLVVRDVILEDYMDRTINENVEPSQIGPVKVNEYATWKHDWKNYRLGMQHAPSECDPELRTYEDNVERLFFLLNPQLHSHIVQLERRERNKLDNHIKSANKVTKHTAP
ncbi:hypothetical protein CPB86DRAFT_829337 [Serendipita vermifera]|nr:hypothetical protein CPB86DRAFT_829337 [Serendipita vermifera]